MAETKLPAPVQNGDFYLAAILDEVKGIRAELADSPAPVVTNTVELREPAQVAEAIEAAGQELGAALSEEAPTEPEKNLLQRIIGR